jgi:UDP-GlcNAc:undecaprenyl-phosphate/decaprenyl-phosphate GlcNAc-1-phosphate transferase
MELLIAGCVLSAFWVSYLGTFGMRWLSPKLGLIDQPAARKVHVTPTPLGGGLAIWSGVLIPLAIVQSIVWWFPQWLPVELQELAGGLSIRSRQLWCVLGAATVLSWMGLADDFRPLPWKPRLMVQFGCAIAIVCCGVRASIFVENAWFGAVVTVVWFVILVNSFNFLDNMDGLSGGIGLIVSSIFALMMLQAPGEPRWLVAGFFLLLAGALSGFLVHNWSPARIFMGDSGSYFVGFSIASMTVLGTFYSADVGQRHTILAPLCVLAIPLYDICSVSIIRLREGRSPFQPDKRHFSHRLVALGFRPVTAVLTVHLATLTTGLGGLALYAVPNWSSATIPVAMVLCVVLMIAILEQTPGPGAPR